MSNATLVLIFSGLIAFVPNDARHPDFMTAYLLKMEGHEARLRVLLLSLVDQKEAVERCEESGCTVSDDTYCECQLQDADITFSPSPEQSRNYIRAAPFGSLPSDENALDLSWLVRLGNINRTNTLGWKIVEDEVSARLVFGWRSATTCAFDEEIVEKTDINTGNKTIERNVYAFDFLPPVDEDQAPHAQAVAELVVFQGSLSSRRLTIRMRRRSGGDAKELRIKCDGYGICPVAISNRLTDSSCKSCEECDYGLHFAIYQKLLSEIVQYPPLPKRWCDSKIQTLPVPSSKECLLRLVKEASFKKLGLKAVASGELLLEAERKRFAVSNRVICPMAILDP